MHENDHLPEGVEYEQVLCADGSVYSAQRVLLPPGWPPDARTLCDRYLRFVRRFTLHLVRPVECGDSVAFRLLLWNLLSFTKEFSAPDSVTLSIAGGILVQRDTCNRGAISFLVTRKAEGVVATVRLADFCPLLLGGPKPSRLRKSLYRHTQAWLHRVVTVRFLGTLYREAGGPARQLPVARKKDREGENI